MYNELNELKEAVKIYQNLPEDKKAYHYMPQDDTDLLTKYLNDYVKEIEAVTSFYEYFEFNDIYGITFTADYNVFKTGVNALEYGGAEVLTAIGGPSLLLKLTLNEGEAVINWGGKRKTAKLKTDTVELLNDYFTDYFEYRVKIV